MPLLTETFNPDLVGRVCHCMMSWKLTYEETEGGQEVYKQYFLHQRR